MSMFPFAWPTASVPNFPLFCFGVLLFGSGRGGKASAVTGEGVKSTKRQRWTWTAVSSIAEHVQNFFDGDRVCQILLGLGMSGASRFASLANPHRPLIMSFLGGSRAAPANGINHEKIDMAITECVPVPTVPPRISFLSRLDTVTDFFNRMVSYVPPTTRCTHRPRHSRNFF